MKKFVLSCLALSFLMGSCDSLAQSSKDAYKRFYRAYGGDSKIYGGPVDGSGGRCISDARAKVLHPNKPQKDERCAVYSIFTNNGKMNSETNSMIAMVQPFNGSMVHEGHCIDLTDGSLMKCSEEEIKKGRIIGNKIFNVTGEGETATFNLTDSIGRTAYADIIAWFNGFVYYKMRKQSASESSTIKFSLSPIEK